jgi:hypothetical protein
MTKKRLWAIGGSAAAIVALMGVAHVPSVQRMLGASCPFAKPPDPAKLEDLRTKSAASLRGTTKATTRDALGFTIDVTTKDQVLAWGARGGATCGEALGGAAIRCEGARVDEGPRAADAFFRFDPRGRLVGVDVMREPASAETASAFFEELVARRTRELGAPSARHGNAAPESLGSGHLMHADAEYRFADYAVDVSVTNFGDDGIVVREQFRSLSM